MKAGTGECRAPSSPALLLAALLAGSGGCDCVGNVGPDPAVDSGAAADASRPHDGATDAGDQDAGLCPPDSPGPTGAVDEELATIFDGVDDAVHLGWGDRALFHRGDVISVMGWVSPTVVDGYDTIVARPMPCGNSGNFMVDLSGGALRFCYMDSTRQASHCAPISSAAIHLGEWTHFAMTHRYGDPSSFRAWVNGSITNEGAWSAGDGAADPVADPHLEAQGGHFAGCATGREYFFEGRTFGIGVYDFELEEEAVRASYCGSARPACVDLDRPEEAVEITSVDPEATGYATFQSHNQKIVDNAAGTFFAYIRTRNEEYTAQTWRLLLWPRGQDAFQTLIEATHGTNPPVLESDLENDVYLMRQSYEAPPDSFLYVLRSSSGYAPGVPLAVPFGSSGKFAMHFDPVRNVLYYFSHEGRFYTIDRAGTVLASPLLITAGTWAVPQYPLIAVDEVGTIYAAWTNVRDGQYLYRSIHVVRSPDGAVSWQKMDGTPLTLPIVCDDSGPADMINLPDELEVHTWLWSVAARAGKVHFAYLGQTTPARQHYVRWDAALGALDLRLQPEVRGEDLSLLGLDGFFVTDPGSPNVLFLVSQSQEAGARIGVLRSLDRGTSWHDHAASEPTGVVYYSITGSRHVSRDGLALGAYTDVREGGARVDFFRVPTRRPDDPVLCF